MRRPPGTSGSSGAPGATGSAGSSGTSRTTPPGFTSGTSGSGGTSGFTGTSGTSGTTPPNFTSGTAGTSGETGTSGTSGTTPPGFTSGTSGTAGVTGTSGTSGTTPPNFTSGTSGTNGFSLNGTTDNGLLTYQAAPVAAIVESNLTFDGTTMSVTGNVASTTYRETYYDYGTGGSVTIDLSLGNNFRRQFNATSTIAFSNAPVSNAFGFTFTMVNAGTYAITWPVNLDWAGGSAPILTSTGVDVLTFFTFDGGTTYYGFVVGKNMS